jgi:hypothetical protein
MSSLEELIRERVKQNVQMFNANNAPIQIKDDKILEEIEQTVFDQVMHIINDVGSVSLGEKIIKKMFTYEF